MYHLRHEFAKLLHEIMGGPLQAVYDKSDKTLPFKAEINPVNSYLTGEYAPCVVKENGLSFHVDWVEGQKTGFFIDQRENRKLVEQFSKGRDVLNMFCYSGGFSFFAMLGGAKLVHSVDSSAKAIDLANNNVALNFGQDERHEAFVADVFDFMRDMKGRYDLIVLDPPAFAKHRGALNQALQAYKRLNARAFEQIRPGGIVFTFSCSQVVSKDKFREAVFSGAAISGRNVRILHQLQQPADHPVNIYHPEGEYLKGLVLYVD
jgi:23S rRNA (cytosine1962-C5)-methyltransferase